MARTYRRRAALHLRAQALSDLIRVAPGFYCWRTSPPNSPQGRRILARFHSDARTDSGPSSGFRRAHNNRVDTRNKRELRRYLVDAGYDPVFDTRHRHSAQWVWW